MQVNFIEGLLSREDLCNRLWVITRWIRLREMFAKKACELQIAGSCILENGDIHNH